MLNLTQGVAGLMLHLFYGNGMRRMESVLLRVNDIDFEYRQIVVRSGEGDKDRVTIVSFPSNSNSNCDRYI